jgi:hypothetical protein
MLLGKPNVELTMGKILQDCQKNADAYSAFKIKERIDIETMVNIEEVSLLF